MANKCASWATLSSIADRMLRKDWTDGNPAFKYKAAHIQRLLSIHLTAAHEVCKQEAAMTNGGPKLCAALSVYVEEVLPRIGRLEKQQTLSGQPAFSRNNFVCFLRPCMRLCETLIEEISTDKGDRIYHEEVVGVLNYVLSLVKCYRKLVHLTKGDFTTAPMLTTVVKSGGE